MCTGNFLVNHAPTCTCITWESCNCKVHMMCNNVHVHVYINLMLDTLFSMVVPVYGDLYGHLSIPPHVHVYT